MPRPTKPLINDDTLAILRFIHRVRYADRDHVTAYCSRPSIPHRRTGFAREAVRDALAQLVKWNYLYASKWYTKRRNPDGYGGRDKLVYVLGKKGAVAIGQRWTSRHVRRISERAPYPSLLRHEMMIPNWHTWLLLAERAGYFTVNEIRGRDHNGGIAEKFINRHGDERTMRIDPDHAVIIEREGRRFPALLEAETGEKSVDHTMKHVRKYANAWRLKLFEPKYGFTDFMVVFLVKTDDKMQHRLRAAGSNDQFARRVLFVSEEHIDLTKPELVMEPMFARASGDFVPLVPSKVRSANATVQEPGGSASSSFHGSPHAWVK